MKTINYTFILILILSTLLFQGCMPDSLTKFKKSTPKAQTKTTGVVIVDTNGNVIPNANITYPTYFYYSKNSSIVTNWDLIVAQTYTEDELQPTYNGSISTTDMFLRCEIDQTGPTLSLVMPLGMAVNTTTCDLSGTPSAIFSDVLAPNIGKEVPFIFRLYFKNAKNYAPGVYGAVTCTSTTECYIPSTPLNIGAYKSPANLLMSQTDKLGIELRGFANILGTKLFSIDDNSTATRTDNVTANNGSIGLVQIRDDDKSILYIQRAIPLTVASSTGFTVGSTVGTFDTFTLGSIGTFAVGDTVTSSPTATYTGKINSITGPVLGVYTVNVFRGTSSGNTFPAGSLTNSVSTIATVSSSLVDPVRGTIVSINSTTIAATISSDFSYDYQIGSVIALQNSSANVTVTAIDQSVLMKTLSNVDNDNQYYSKEASISLVTGFYPVNTSITPIKSIIGSNDTMAQSNGITYSIGPGLPTGLSFDTTTGIISGSFLTELSATTFTITATNPVGSTSFDTTLSAVFPPKDLSYTNNQVINVSNAVITGSGTPIPNSVFYEGDDIFQPIKTPATESIRGKIKRKLANDILVIDNLNGLFKTGASIDSGRKYTSEKAYISSTATSYSYNVILYVASTASFVIGEYVSSSSNAVGKVVYIDPTLNALFIQFLTPDTSITPKTFAQGDSIDDAISYTAAETTITKIEANAYKLSLGSSASFGIGKDATALTGSSTVSSYIFDINTTSNYILVDTVSKTPSTVDSNNIVTAHFSEFANGQNIDYRERYTAATTSITAVTHENIFAINRGESIVLNPNLTQGSGLNFSVTPALPIGLTLDALTGIISGTPTYLTALKPYIITAENLLGSSSFKVNMEVRDFFTLAELGDSTSFMLHKIGDTQNTRKCRVSASDIINARGNLDIRCFLDGQEEDFHFQSLKFRGLIGSGVCEYIQYAPLSFQTFKPNFTSVGTINYISGCEVTTAMGIPAWRPATYVIEKPTKDKVLYCPANYTSDDKAFPNCDETEFTIKTYTSTIDTATGNCNLTSTATEVVKCGGNKHACVQTAFKDLAGAKIEAGFRSVISAVQDGQTAIYDHKTPFEYLDLTNLRVSNFTTNNTCSTINSHTTNWEQYVYGLTATANSLTAAAKTAAYRVNPFINGVPVYVFNCLDAAYDVKARIRVHAREWDRKFNITNSIDLDDPNPFAGTCADGVSTTQAACTLAASTWTGKQKSGAGVDPYGYLYNNYDSWDNDYMSVGNYYFPATGNLPASAYGAASCNGNTMPGAGTEYAFPADEI